MTLVLLATALRLSNTPNDRTCYMLATLSETPRISKKDWDRSIRCDSCPAAAHVLAWKIIEEKVYELTFCLHHGQKNFDGLVMAEFNIEHDPLPSEKDMAKLTEND